MVTWLLNFLKKVFLTFLPLLIVWLLIANSEGLLFHVVMLVCGVLGSVYIVRMVWRNVPIPWNSTAREATINQFSSRFRSERYNNIGAQWTDGLEAKARSMIHLEPTAHIWVAMAEANAAKDRNRQLDLANTVIHYLNESTVVVLPPQQ